MEEATTNNQAAPVTTEQSVEAGQAAQTGSEGGASAPASAVKTPPTAGTNTGQPDFDVRKSYEELRKEFTRRTQHEKELLNRLTSIQQAARKQAELLAKATEEPHNPDVFMESWKSQGPKALDPYYQRREQAIREEYDKKISELQTQ